MSLDIRPHPEHPFGGYALLLAPAADVPGAEARVSVFDNYSERYLAPGGWQSAPVTFGPFPVTRDGDRARLVLGPEIVNQIEENAPLRITIDAVEYDIDWPVDVHPEAARPRDVALTGTRSRLSSLSPGVARTPPGGGGTVEPPFVPPAPSRRPMLLAGGAALILALAAAAWFLTRPEPEQPPPPPPPPPVPIASCDAATLRALAGKPFAEITAALGACGAGADQDAALGLVEDGAAANDPGALLLFGQLYDGGVTVPGIETTLGLTFGDAPATAAEYYSRARAAGAPEAAGLLGPLCARLREQTDTLSQGAVADHCDP